MNSILKEVKEYIIKNNIPFKDICVSYECFPKYINQAILNKIREIKGIGYDLGSSTYILSFDKNNNLYLLVNDSEGYTNLIIADTPIYPTKDIKYTQVPEIEIIEDACMLEYLSNERISVREMIDKEYKKLSPIEKVRLENNIINLLAKNKFNDLSKNNDNILNKVSYKEANKKTVKLITDYINYLDAYYEQDLEIDAEVGEGIYFNEPDADPRGRIINKNKYPEPKERVNEIIPFTDRYQFLESYPYLYADYAYSKAKGQIEYMNYLFEIGYHKYVLILEPYNGTKVTRIAVIESDKKPTIDEFNEYVRHYLELSTMELLEDPTVVRTFHTTLDTYKLTIDYAITGNNEKIINPYYKKRMKGIKEDSI